MLVRASSGSGGSGGIRKISTLWSLPTADRANMFNAQDIALSESMSNYDYIQIIWACSTTNTQTNGIIIKVSELIADGVATTSSPKFSLSARVSTTHSRLVTYKDTTHLSFQAAYNLNSGGQNNSAAIPYNVYGLRGELE